MGTYQAIVSILNKINRHLSAQRINGLNIYLPVHIMASS